MATTDPSRNGQAPPPDRHADLLAELRTKQVNVHLFRGYGPFVVGAILVVLMLLLAPSVAPEQVVERPASTSTTTTVAP